MKTNDRVEPKLVAKVGLTHWTAVVPIVNVELNASVGFKSQAALHVENLALRHQLGVLRRSVKRAKLTTSDRILRSWLSHVLE